MTEALVNLLFQLHQNICKPTIVLYIGISKNIEIMFLDEYLSEVVRDIIYNEQQRKYS